MHRLPHLFGHLQERLTSREGVEYASFNNVETKPGVGYPHQWENQTVWNGGCGFSFGNGCSGGTSGANLFGTPKRKRVQTPTEVF